MQLKNYSTLMYAEKLYAEEVDHRYTDSHEKKSELL